jgi:hypothetical protein
MSDTETVSCSIAPSVTVVVLQDLGEVPITSLDGVDMAVVAWNTTGDIDTVSLLLEREDNLGTLPIPIAQHIVNSGFHLWEVPVTLAAGTYHVRVEYGDIAGQSTSITKTTASETLGCPSVDCNGHGVCDDDTNSTCVCRYGWDGTTCDMEPVDITRISATVIVDTPYSTAMADQATFKALFRTDMAASLLVVSDQIEVVALLAGATTEQTRVEFNVLMGGSFHPSPFAFNNTATLTTTLQSMLSTSDSTLNNGVIGFTSVVKEETTPTGPTLSAASSTSTPASAALFATLVVASVAALF